MIFSHFKDLHKNFLEIPINSKYTASKTSNTNESRLVSVNEENAELKFLCYALNAE